MFDGDIQVTSDGERFSAQREVLIAKLTESILEHGTTDSFLSQEVNIDRNTRNYMSIVASKTAEHHLDLRSTSRHDHHIITAIVKKGMEIAYSTHNLSNDRKLLENTQDSLQYTAFHLNRLSREGNDESIVHAHYESAMEFIDAEDAVNDSVEPERNLVDHFAYQFSQFGQAGIQAFRLGYGTIRRAALLPHTSQHERQRYNLETLGLTSQLSELFNSYCNDELVYESSSIETYIVRRKIALDKFENDPFVQKYIFHGQIFSIADGVALITSSPTEEQRLLRKYQAIGANYPIKKISGVFIGFAADEKLPQSELEAVMNRGNINTDTLNNSMSSGLYMRLYRPLATYDNFDEYTVPEPDEMNQRVLIPLYLEGQQLIYHNSET